MPKPDTDKSQQVRLDPPLEKRTRRTYTADFRLSVLQQAAACKHGEHGALLRREKLYCNQLAQWRREFETEGVIGLSKSRSGSAAAKMPEQRQIEQLEKKNARLKKQMRVKHSCLELQKELWR